MKIGKLLKIKNKSKIILSLIVVFIMASTISFNTSADDNDIYAPQITEEEAYIGHHPDVDTSETVEIEPSVLEDSNQVFRRSTFSLLSKGDDVEELYLAVPKGSGLLYVYLNETTTSAFTYSSRARSSNGTMAVLQIGSKRTKVAFAGVIGWVDSDHIELTPLKDAVTNNYYQISNGEFIHTISYDPKGTTGTNIIMSSIPSYIKPNTKYLSFDGHYFYENSTEGYRNLVADYNNGTNKYPNAINPNDPFYNYFQFISLNTQSKLNAADLRRYLQNNQNSQGNYNAQDTKLYELEQVFIDYGNELGINAGLVFANAVHESGFGRSVYSKDRNNLFGHNAVDSNPDLAWKYDSAADNVNFHMSSFINWGYAYDWRYYGAVIGDKSQGMNVKYASDPYWGEKIAQHLYRIDKAAGFKDLNRYTIGIVEDNDLIVRKDASTSSGQVYVNKLMNFPITIIEEKNGTSVNNTTKWYGFTSDQVLDSNKNPIKLPKAFNDLDQATQNQYKTRRRNLNESTVYVNSSFVKVVSKVKDSKLTTQPRGKFRSLPTFDEKNITVYTLDDVKLRPEWNTDFSEILVIPKGTELKSANKTTNGWLQVSYSAYSKYSGRNVKYTGYISGEYASKTLSGGPVSDGTVTPETPLFEIGDVNGDGSINSLDYRWIKEYIMGTRKLTEEQLYRADFEKDGKVNSLDYMKIKNLIMGR